MSDTMQIPGAPRIKRKYERKQPYVKPQAAIPQEEMAPEPAARETRANDRPKIVGRDEYGRIQVTGRDGKVISRTRTGSEDLFHVPDSIKPPGWSYEWKKTSVTGEPATGHQTMLAQNGWTAVPAIRHDGMFMPQGYKGPIERDGLMLMERPQILTDEARAEDERRTKAQVNVNKRELDETMPRGFTTEHRELPNQIKSNFEPSSVPRPKLEIAPD